MTKTVSIDGTHAGTQGFCRTFRSVDRIGPEPRVFVRYGRRVDEGLARSGEWLRPLPHEGERLRRGSAQRSGSAGATGASRSVTPGSSLKPLRDEIRGDLVWRKIDQLQREVGR